MWRRMPRLLATVLVGAMCTIFVVKVTNGSQNTGFSTKTYSRGQEEERMEDKCACKGPLTANYGVSLGFTDCFRTR